MLRVDRWSPHHLERAADTASELRCTLIGSESSLRSQEAAHKHSQPLMMIVEMYALRPAAAVAEEHRQLEHQRCQTGGGMPGDRPEAVAVFASRLRSIAAVSTTAAKWPPKASNQVGFKSHLSTLGPSFRRHDRRHIDRAIKLSERDPLRSAGSHGTGPAGSQGFAGQPRSSATNL